MRPVIEAGDHLNGREACRLLGCSATVLQRLAMLGQIAVKLEPGVPPRYHRGDVERLAETRRHAGRISPPLL